MRLEELRNRKGKEKIVMLTAYDFQIAKILDEVGIDIILVGDSLGMAVQGCSNTRGVTMDDMLYHTHAVARGANKTPIVVDMPINSDSNAKDALSNAKMLLDAGGHGVKIEGNKTEVIKALIGEGIPVMAHLGLLPQTATAYRVTGKVINDMLGLDPSFSPKYIKRYADLNGIARQAVSDFAEEVREGKYPGPEHTYH